jgi:protein tyrosine phosphatase
MKFRKLTSIALVGLSAYSTQVFALETTATLTVPVVADTLPTLPKSVREEHFKRVEAGFKKRWQRYSHNYSFASWTPGRTEDSLLREYHALDTKRRSAWFEEPYAKVLVSRKDYQIDQRLLANGFYRHLVTVAFQYNKTDDSYNSSTVIIDGHRFLALEGPKPEHVLNFFNLLVNHHATHLVRLTPAFEGAKPKCAPYWENRLITDPNGKMQIQIPQSTLGPETYDIPYYAVENWLDATAGEPEQLLNFVVGLKNSIDPNKDNLIAVHYSAGVSRTGTVLAAYLLLNQIDQQVQSGIAPDKVNISVEKVVSQLSLQRSQAVGDPPQYVTLYRMMDLYVNRLAKRLSKRDFYDEP